MDRWTELRTTYHVARLGTVSAAAEALGLHRATVNRHIDALEAEIGGKIFLRHARGYTLTEIGLDVLRVAQKAEELIEDLAGRVQGGKDQIAGEIKLTILAPFAPFIMPAITAFRLQNPQCRVDLDVGDSLARLEYGEAHIALRAGTRPEHPDYVVSSFGDIRFNLYAHESYIARNGFPEGPEDMASHQFVLPNLPEGRSPFAAWIGAHVRPETIALTSHDIPLTIDAITAGLGLGFLSEDDANRRGNLRPVLPSRSEWLISGWIVTHTDLHRTEKVQAMLSNIKTFRPSARAPQA